MCWLAISPPLKGEGTKSAEGCPRRCCKPAASPSVVVVVLLLLLVVVVDFMFLFFALFLRGT